MGRVLTMRLGLGYSAGDVITYNSGAAHIQVVSLGSGSPVDIVGSGGEITLPAGSLWRTFPANGWIYTLQADGTSNAERDTSFVPLEEPPPAPPAPGDTEVVDIVDYVPPPGARYYEIPPPAPRIPPDQVASEPGAAQGIPMWVWIVGGGLVVYAVSRR